MRVWTSDKDRNNVTDISLYSLFLNFSTEFGNTGISIYHILLYSELMSVKRSYSVDHNGILYHSITQPADGNWEVTAPSKASQMRLLPVKKLINWSLIISLSSYKSEYNNVLINQARRGRERSWRGLTGLKEYIWRRLVI